MTCQNLHLLGGLLGDERLRVGFMVPQVLKGRSCLIIISLTLDETYQLNPWVIRQTRQNYYFRYYKDKKKDAFVMLSTCGYRVLISL